MPHAPRSPTWGEALEALKRPLAFAARDNFAHLDRVIDLGPTLQGASARLAPLVGGERAEKLLAWARELAVFPSAPRSAREQLVARGMRLVATCALDAPPPPPPPPRAPAPARSQSAVVAPPAVAAPSVAKPVIVKAVSAAPTDLATPLAGLPGVGPRTAERLAARGLRTAGDALHFIPRRWDDLRALVPVGELKEGVAQTTRATVRAARVVFGRRRFLEVTLAGDDGVTLRALWFYVRGNAQARFPVGARLLVSGTPRRYKDALQMAHPETTLLEPGEEGAEGGALRARYPEVEGVPGRTVERLCRAVAAVLAERVPDGVPESVRSRRAMPSQSEALRALHLALDGAEPTTEEVEALNAGRTRWHRRLAYDELFFVQLGLARRRAEARREGGLPCPPDAPALERFLAALPFAPTGAQRRAIAEIGADLAQPHPMHRLLQGDVGSGKTLVLFAAATQAMAAGYQVAVMAPTEILAEQHARTLDAWSRATGRRAAVLTASTPRGARESTRSLLAGGGIDLVIGTHALLAEGVGFHRLGLVVIDEQHRFGVAQRATLRDKGGASAPHLLVMTATPIPRTLALTAYGDLDLTLLDELPPGREPPETRVLTGARGRAAAYALLRQAIADGRQAYVVCPLVEESEKIDAEIANAEETYARLVAELPDVTVGLVHGRVATAERDQVMDRFRRGEVQLLVATTVIEVGVDVPRASVMLIEGAERFGLAQLHQLRGRIGRGGGRALCLLVTDSAKSGDAGARLDVMAKSGDGFVIAEEDLKLRGPGELYGTRQAGMPRLHFADLVRDLDLLRDARADAFALLDGDRELAKPEHALTRAVLEARYQAGDLFGEEAG